MKKHFLLYLFTSLLFSNQIIIEGTILNENNEPIKDVNIYSNNIGTTSNEEGVFKITLPKHSYITFSHIAFQETQIMSSEFEGSLIMNTEIINSDKVIVTSALKSEKLIDSKSSITVFNKNEIRNKSGSHFEYLIDEVPNLTSIGGTSRSRYFQIRGIGERSQYTGETSPNFSVGYILDGIDMSGLGMMGHLFDTKQIEIYKGPQSSVYGVNSLAGIINIKTQEPTPFITGNFKSTIGSDNIKTNGLAVGFPISSNIIFKIGEIPINYNFLVRISGQMHSQNGFRYNTFSNSDSTNMKNESFYRAKVHWLMNDFLKFKYTYFNSHINNNYDVWSPDNNKDYLTYTDRHGKDSLSTIANSLVLDFDLINKIKLEGYYKYTNTVHDIIYSYDGDWGNDAMWLLDYGFDPSVEGYAYDFFDKTVRQRQSRSHELRLNNIDNTIIVGAYVSFLNEKDDANGYLFGGDATSVASNYDITNTAYYGQMNIFSNTQTDITLNLRYENHKTFYDSNSNNYGTPLPNVDKSILHDHLGFKVSILHKLNSQKRLYVTASQGFKAGGVNQNPYLSEDSRFYSPEHNASIESGYTTTSDNHRISINVFYMIRDNQHVQISSQQDVGDPNSFYYFTANAGKGYNYGLEYEQKINLTQSLALKGSLGLLKTYVDNYTFDSGTDMLTLGGREQAISPMYNFNVGIDYDHYSGLFTKLEMSGKDEYFYSESHDQKSTAYLISNGEIGIDKERWNISIWCKNIFNKRYPIRGFYFGLEPPDFTEKLYIQWSEPQHYGITLSYQF
tara:strand:- start:5 stop:2365 length:2361 start_codon:yes stop_codon:yes gene_type:complete